MMRVHVANPRGAALLVVLATLLLTVTATTILVRAAGNVQARRGIDQCTVIADDLLRAAEAPIQDWLSSESSKVVLPPDAPSPRVSVLHDDWVAGEYAGALSITAWDQCGMVAVEMIMAGSPLRLTLPAAILRLIDETVVEPGAGSGLDLYKAKADPDSAGLPLSPFPQRRVEVDSIDAEPATLGELVAIRNQEFQINVNTAPVNLIEAALRAANRGGLEQIIAARSQGKPASIGGRTVADPEQRKLIPQLVTTSTIWSFRIDAHVGSVRKSWWAVYAPLTRRSKQSRSSANQEHPYQWECLQRLVITY